MFLLLCLPLLFPFCESSTTPYSFVLNTSVSGDKLCAMQKESSSLTYVVDTTGSMSDDLQELKLVNSWLLDRITARFPCGVRQYTMVEFNDPTIGPVRITDSKAEFGSFFNNLVANGGGDCPELAMGGLQLALQNSPPKSFILLLTDASALDYNNATLLNNIRSLLNTTKSQVFFLITGLCGTITSPDFLVYRDIAALSFGHVFQVALSDLNKVFNYLDLTLSRPANTSERLFSGEYSAGNNSGSFSVANNFTALLITTDGVIYSIQVLGPDYVSLGIKKIVSETWGSVYLVNTPANGRWTIITNAGSPCSVRVEGLTAVNISSAGRCSECHPNATCEDYLGYKQCNCKEGFIGDGFNCSDVDECTYPWMNNCSVGICKNTFGSYTCVCPSGYNKSGNACVDINECSSAGLNRCHSLATCINYIGYYSCACPYGYFGDGIYCEINECMRGACGYGVDCIKTNGSFQCSEPCTNYTTLNEPWRSTSYGYSGVLNCDISKNGWYRFIGSGGVRMPETCVPQLSCNTHAPVWLNGSHPMIGDGTVNRTVCASFSGSCCLWSSTIKVKACPGGYHVYKLSGTPMSVCTLSYCTDPNTTNSLLCAADEDWKLRNGVYGCYCKDKYEVLALADIRPQLTCGINDMRALFQKCQFKSLSYNVSSVALKDISCFGFQDEPITDTFSVLAPLQAGRCGVQIIKNGTHAIYQSSLHLAMESTGLIQRSEELTVTMSCAYPLDMLISLNTVVNPLYGSTNISIGGTGQLTANMALYKDNSYVTPYEGSEVVLSSKSVLYIGVFVQGGDTSRYNLVMKNCYATPTSRPDDSVKYYIIKDSCPNKQDSTISVQENGVSRKGRFSVEVFKFVGNYNYLYMHCAISMCDVTSGSCIPSCSGIASRSAASDESYQLSVGPVIRADVTSQSSGSVGTQASCALLGLVLCLLANTLMV